jgi:predicted nucleic acid-binding protein
VLERSRAGDFMRAIQEADTVMAPELLVPEVVNAIWKYHQFDHLDLNTCNQALELAIMRIPRDADQRSELMSITIPK